ncbi:MAG: hypothetical protein WBF00_17580, partial [Methylocella sp.]
MLGERDRLRAPPQPLEADPHLEPIVAQLNMELAGFFRTQPKLHLRVTATDSDGLLEAVVPHYAQTGAGLGLPARRHGSGLISLQHLLLLLQFGRQRAEAHEVSGWRWKSRSYMFHRRYGCSSLYLILRTVPFGAGSLLLMVVRQRSFSPWQSGWRQGMF